MEINRLLPKLEKEADSYELVKGTGRVKPFRARRAENKQLKENIQALYKSAVANGKNIGMQSIGSDERWQTHALRLATLDIITSRYQKASKKLKKSVSTFDRKVKKPRGFSRVQGSNRSPRRAPPPIPGGLLGSVPVNPNTKQPAKRGRRGSHVHVRTEDQP